MLVVVSKDPNDQYYPSISGAVETKTKDSLRWLLELLLQDIGRARFFSISDQHNMLLQLTFVAHNWFFV